VDDLRDAELGGLDHGAHGGRDPGQFLDDDGLGEVAKSESAVAGVDRDAEPLLAGDLPGQVVCHGPGCLQFRDVGSDFGLGERADRVPQVCVAGGEVVAVDHLPISS